MAQPQVFPGIDGAKWVRIQALILKETGITMAGNSGDAKKDGIELSWDYNPQSLELTTLLVKRSIFDPSEATIDGDIAKLVEQA